MRIAVKRSLAWAMASVAVSGIALAVMLWSRAERNIDAKAAQAPDGNAPAAARDPGNGAVPPPAADPAQGLDRDHALWQICPSLWGDLSDDCVAELELRYADGSAEIDTPILPPPLLPPRTPITWRQAYADPAATRRTVAAALRNPECSVAMDQVRLDLREVCAADAMARFAILQHQCGTILLRGVDVYQRQQKDLSSKLEDSASLDVDEYRRLRTESWFESAWHVRKCRDAESTVTAWLPEFPAPSEDPLGNSHDQSLHLIMAAARLGSEWALAHMLGSEWALSRLPGSVARINAMAELDLATAYAARAMMTGSVESDRYLHYAMAAGYYAQMRGVSPHEIWLPAGECGSFGGRRCQAAIQEARRIVERGWQPMVDR